MELSRLEKISPAVWRIAPHEGMRVPAIIYGSEDLIASMDEKVFVQVTNVARLPGIVHASYAMPDAHWGYGFPIGGVAAFDPKEGGVISAGGVGFDISCGVRTHLTHLKREKLAPVLEDLAEALFREIPAGVGSQGEIILEPEEMTAMLSGGARWAAARGFGVPEDLLRIEEEGCMPGAQPAAVSGQARARQRREMGTLGSGNHYLEVQEVAEVYDTAISAAYGLAVGECVVTIHCGSRGLGHQVGTDYLQEMAAAAAKKGVALPDRELACAPLTSALGVRYLGAMRAAINCALANRQILGHLARKVFARFFGFLPLPLLFDISHNTCKAEIHKTGGEEREIFVHRKGATRAFGPGHPDLPEDLRPFGQPVLIGGSMGTASYVLAGVAGSEARAFSSACHGAGRQMSRHAAARAFNGRLVIDELRTRGILVRSPSLRGVAEEAPGAYKDAGAVVAAAEAAGLARKIARLTPLISIKG